jgi:glycosyltransferase involved in cell wall biosynthesis
MATIVFLAPLGAIRKRTRLAKMASLIRARGDELLFIGWEREKGEAEALRSADTGIRETVILRGGGYASRRTRLFYPLWMIVVFLKTLRLGRDKALFCLGWETAFPARLAAVFTGARVIFDDADRFSMIVGLPGPLHRWLEALERWTSRSVALHLVPSFSRYQWRHPRMLELGNSPLLADMERARANPPSRPAAALVVYANGWIGESRGAPVFLRALDLIDARSLDIRMVIAGRVTGPGADELIEHPRVTFLGEVSQSEALAWYAAVDVLLTYYDPSVPINRTAESNKWGDAVFFGTPFIVNTEVETAAGFVAAGAAWAVPYDDAGALVDLLNALSRDQALVRSAAERLAEFRASYRAFDERMTEILDMAQSEGERAC